MSLDNFVHKKEKKEGTESIENVDLPNNPEEMDSQNDDQKPEESKRSKKAADKERLANYLQDPYFQQHPDLQPQVTNIVTGKMQELKWMAKDYRIENISTMSRSELEQAVLTCIKTSMIKFPSKWSGKCACNGGKTKLKIQTSEPPPEFCPKCNTTIYFKRQ